jgi:antitoxin component YwqK of YwqJK toxin-antitoxin module
MPLNRLLNPALYQLLGALTLVGSCGAVLAQEPTLVSDGIELLSSNSDELTIDQPTVASPQESSAPLISRSQSEQVQKSVELIQQRHPNGKPMIERHVTLDADGNYVNHGQYQQWNENGEPILVGHFQMGQKHGEWNRFCSAQESKLFEKEPYKSFKPPYQSSVEFQQGQMHGIWTIADKDNRTISQIQLEKGQRDGPAIWYHPSGAVYIQSEYRNGLLHGKFLEMDSKGKLVRESVFHQGQLVSKKQDWFPNKKVKEDYEFLGPSKKQMAPDNWNTSSLAVYESDDQETKHGSYIAYYENGSVRTQAQYRHGQLEGRFESWYSTGQKESSGNYVNGAQDGQWSWWHPNGMRRAVSQYDQGKLAGHVQAWNEQGQRVEPVALAQSTIDKPAAQKHPASPNSNRKSKTTAAQRGRTTR